MLRRLRFPEVQLLWRLSWHEEYRAPVVNAGALETVFKALELHIHNTTLVCAELERFDNEVYFNFQRVLICLIRFIRSKAPPFISQPRSARHAASCAASG